MTKERGRQHRIQSSFQHYDITRVVILPLWCGLRQPGFRCSGFGALLREECDNRIEFESFCGVQGCTAVVIRGVHIHAKFDGYFNRFQNECLALTALDFSPRTPSPAHPRCGHYRGGRFLPMVPGNASAFHDFVGTVNKEWIGAMFHEKAHDFGFSKSSSKPEGAGSDQLRLKIEITR